MRTDKKLNLNAQDFDTLMHRPPADGDDPFDIAAGVPTLPLSGHERDHLFISDQAKQFYEVSAISGLDHDNDGRVASAIDYDLDGWIDFAMVAANAPFLQLYRNRIGEIGGEKAARFVAVRFVGGNRSAAASQLAPRDGYGAKAILDLGDGMKLTREHRCGDGFAAQHSNTLLIGIGARDGVASLRVVWPNGAAQELRDVRAGELITAFEDPQAAPDGASFHREAYPGERSGPRVAGDGARAVAAATPGLMLAANPAVRNAGRLKVVTTMATWCAACKGELPQLATLRAAFGADEVAMFGVPVDPKDSAQKLSEYAQKYQPAYDLLTGLRPEEVASVQGALKEALKIEALPSTLILDAEGRVLEATTGLPTISTLRRLLDREVR